MSFILDALRKSEHERQRSALPSLAHVPVATPPTQLPRWATFVIALLAAAVLVLAGAWWQSAREPAAVSAVAPPPMVERPLPLPAPAESAPSGTPPSLSPPAVRQPLADAARTAASEPLAAAARAPTPTPTPITTPAASSEAATLPSAASLIAEGVVLPALRLELHGYAEQPSARFVFINGRKYVEGERLAEGPDLVAVEARGAVLSYSGRRFLLLPD